MPADFEKCRAEGGRIRTKSLGKGRYMHICFKDGESFAGEVKHKLEKTGKGTYKSAE